MVYKIPKLKSRKFQVTYTAFKGTKYAQESAEKPIIEARDVESAVKKFNKRPYHNKHSITKVEEI